MFFHHDASSWPQSIYIFSLQKALSLFLEGLVQRENTFNSHIFSLTSNCLSESLGVLFSNESLKGCEKRPTMFSVSIFFIRPKQNLSIFGQDSHPSPMNHLKSTMNHLKSTPVPFATKHTCCGSKWTPANAEESAQKSPAWSQMPWTLVDVPWEILEVDGKWLYPWQFCWWPFWGWWYVTIWKVKWPLKMSLWITWPLVFKATVIGFEVVFASKIDFCILGKQFTTYSRGFNQEFGGAKKYGRLVQNSGTPKKQTHWMLTSSKMDSQNHYLGVYPWVCLWSVGPI